ncbi:MAG TPA: cyclase family protein [Steroidobacteraceae bacterium]|jgi:kynurenine formamidase
MSPPARASRVIDLTQPLGPATVMWPGSSPPSFRTVDDYREGGSFSRVVSIYEHTGTHLDAPAHFVEGAETVDRIPADRLVCEVSVINIETQAAADPDYGLTIADIEESETTYGEIPRGSAVVIHSGWAARRTSARDYLGDDGSGRLSFPGISPQAALWLIRHRQVIGLGIDTPGIDPGKDTEFTVHRHSTLPNGVWQLEGLINLDRLPARGATLFVGVLPFVGGSGAPARVIALV